MKIDASHRPAFPIIKITGAFKEQLFDTAECGPVPRCLGEGWPWVFHILELVWDGDRKLPLQRKPPSEDAEDILLFMHRAYLKGAAIAGSSILTHLNRIDAGTSLSAKEARELAATAFQAGLLSSDFSECEQRIDFLKHLNLRAGGKHKDPRKSAVDMNAAKLLYLEQMQKGRNTTPARLARLYVERFGVPHARDWKAARPKPIKIESMIRKLRQKMRIWQDGR